MTVTRPLDPLHLRRNGSLKGTRHRDIGSAVPRGLAVAAAWTWWLLLIEITAYAAVWMLAMLSLVVIPLIAAVLLAALLRPLTESLHRRLPESLSALLTLFLAVVVLGGLGYLIGVHFAQQLPSLIEQLVGTIHRLRADVVGSDVGPFQINQIERSLVDWLQRNRSQTVGYVTTGASYALEFLTLTALTLFIAFLLLYDGERIWRWLISPFSVRASRRVDLAGRAAWATISGYVRGTAVIAPSTGA